MMTNLSMAFGRLLRPYVCFYYAPIRHNRIGREVLPCWRPLDETLLDPYRPVRENDEKIALFLNELEPPPKKGFNFAAYVNSSKSLQELIKLGVSLYDIENTDKKAAQTLLKLDFERDCLPYIRFLIDHGIKECNLGRFISEYPAIFVQPIDKLVGIIKYLKSSGFSERLIARSLDRSAHILMHCVKTIDYKIAEFQIEFNMPADEVITVVSEYPQLIGFPKEQYRMVKFVIREEFGFKLSEIHRLLRNQPKIIGFKRINLIERLELVHNVIGLSHSTIVKFPKLITGPKLDITHRHEYLKKLNRNQYDPSKPLYVPPLALYKPTDLEFCLNYSKTSLGDYKLFLKSC